MPMWRVGLQGSTSCTNLQPACNHGPTRRLWLAAVAAPGNPLIMPFLSLREQVNFVVGAVMMISVVPLVGVVVGSTVLWDGLDRLFRGRPLDGVLMSTVRWFNQVDTRSRVVLEQVQGVAWYTVVAVGRRSGLTGTQMRC